MARRKIKSVSFGNCNVSIFREPETGEFIVRSAIAGKIVGGAEGGGYFTDDKKDARSTAAATIRQMRKQYTACRARRR